MVSVQNNKTVTKIGSSSFSRFGKLFCYNFIDYILHCLNFKTQLLPLSHGFSGLVFWSHPLVLEHCRHAHLFIYLLLLIDVWMKDSTSLVPHSLQCIFSAEALDDVFHCIFYLVQWVFCSQRLCVFSESRFPCWTFLLRCWLFHVQCWEFTHSADLFFHLGGFPLQVLNWMYCLYPPWGHLSFLLADFWNLHMMFLCVS